MISTALFCIIVFLVLDLFLLLWIIKLRRGITSFQSQESAICPLYFCDLYTDPTTGSLQPGSLCYNGSTGPDDMMVAYRYVNSDQTSYSCQNSLIANNIILTDQTYLPQAQL